MPSEENVAAMENIPLVEISDAEAREIAKASST